MSNALIEKAKNVPVQTNRKEYTKNEIELAVAWLRGEVQNKQCAEAMEFKALWRWTITVGQMLRKAYQQGLIK